VTVTVTVVTAAGAGPAASKSACAAAAAARGFPLLVRPSGPARWRPRPPGPATEQATERDTVPGQPAPGPARLALT
jgi:hypothetical protein